MSDSILYIIFMGIWLTLPAYVANPSAVLFGGGAPMDFGRKMKSGGRILGDGKTWRGFFGGIFSAIVLGLILIGISIPFDEEHFGFGAFPDFLVIIILMSTGALLGDVLGSFVKRRLGKKRGAKTPGLDQYDFLLGAWLLLIIFKTKWFFVYILC